MYRNFDTDYVSSLKQFLCGDVDDDDGDDDADADVNVVVDDDDDDDDDDGDEDDDDDGDDNEDDDDHHHHHDDDDGQNFRMGTSKIFSNSKHKPGRDPDGENKKNLKGQVDLLTTILCKTGQNGHFNRF